VAVAVWLAVGAGPSLSTAAQDDLYKVPKILTAKPIQNAPGDDELQKLLKARYNESVAETALRYQDYLEGKERIDPLLDAANRWLRAGMELYPRPQERAALLKRMLEVADRLEAFRQSLLTTTKPARFQREGHKLRQWRLDIEINLVKAKKAASG
jgi:hypothetical protein